MSEQSGFSGLKRDPFSQDDLDVQETTDEMSFATAIESVRDPLVEVERSDDLYPFDHPYPRFGLAYVLYRHGIGGDFEAVLRDEKRLARLAAETIDECLDYVRIHTKDSPDGEGERHLHFYFVPRNELRAKGQKTGDFYFLAPHVAADNTTKQRYRQQGALIEKARGFRDTLAKGEKLHKSTPLRRSFSPFTTKINEGTAGLSDPKTTFLQAAFTLIATLAPHKPAAQIDFTNQVVIPDLDVARLIRFIDLFGRMQRSETDDPLTTIIHGKSRRRRPPLCEGNYPGAPRSAVFGPVGLIAAMGRWIRRAEAMQEHNVTWATKTLEALPKRPLYLVSYDSSLTRQAQLGHHVTRLALNHDLPKALGGLYRASLYNTDDNQRGSPTRKLFDQMASRFLQFYTRAAFRDFLAFRAQYGASFSPILEDYMTEQRRIPKDIVSSAREYGRHLNRQAWEAGLREEKTKDTNRSAKEAQTVVLNQMESLVMNGKRAGDIFARLNREARQIDNWDAPKEALRFIEASLSGEEVNLQDTKDLILTFMRVRTSNAASAKGEVKEEAPEKSDPMMQEG